MDIVSSSENVAIDSEQDQFVDHQKDEQTQNEQYQEYQFDVIVIGSGPGDGYVY
jgi:hypothetical protein